MSKIYWKSYKQNKVREKHILKNKRESENKKDLLESIKRKSRVPNYAEFPYCIINATRAVHRAGLATPKWVDHCLVQDMYLEAKYQQLEVDHIVPLKGANVCGLHWEGNMQLLSRSENSRKHNKHE